MACEGMCMATIVKGATGPKCNDLTDSTCTTKNVGGWVQQSGCSVYTQSRVPQCYESDWDSASELCSTAGGRLCTREELESNCARGGGCGLNTKMVWSSTANTNECSR